MSDLELPFVIEVDKPLLQRELIRKYAAWMLARHGNNKTHTAKALGIDRRSLYRLLENQPQP